MARRGSEIKGSNLIESIVSFISEDYVESFRCKVSRYVGDKRSPLSRIRGKTKNGKQWDSWKFSRRRGTIIAIDRLTNVKVTRVRKSNSIRERPFRRPWNN